jgi:hypothetical protein
MTLSRSFSSRRSGEDGLQVGNPHALGEELREDVAEVGRDGEVPVLAEVRRVEVGPFAVVGATVGVLADPAASDERHLGRMRPPAADRNREKEPRPLADTRLLLPDLSGMILLSRRFWWR